MVARRETARGSSPSLPDRLSGYSDVGRSWPAPSRVSPPARITQTRSRSEESPRSVSGNREAARDPRPRPIGTPVSRLACVVQSSSLCSQPAGTRSALPFDYALRTPRSLRSLLEVRSFAPSASSAANSRDARLRSPRPGRALVRGRPSRAGKPLAARPLRCPIDYRVVPTWVDRGLHRPGFLHRHGSRKPEVDRRNRRDRFPATVKRRATHARGQSARPCRGSRVPFHPHRRLRQATRDSDRVAPAVPRLAGVVPAEPRRQVAACR